MTMTGRPPNFTQGKLKLSKRYPARKLRICHCLISEGEQEAAWLKEAGYEFIVNALHG